MSAGDGLAALLAGLLAGCTLTRRLDPLPEPLAVVEPVEARVVLVIERPWNPFRAPPARLAHIDRARVERALRASGCFEFEVVRLEVEPVVAWLAFPVGLGQVLDAADPGLPKLELVLTLAEDSGGHLLALLTLGLFPRCQRDQLGLRGTLRTPAGQVLAQVERKERLETWTSCLLHPQLTVKFGEERVDEALEALVRSVAAEVARGALTERAARRAVGELGVVKGEVSAPARL